MRFPSLQQKKVLKVGLASRQAVIKKVLMKSEFQKENIFGARTEREFLPWHCGQLVGAPFKG